MVKVIDVLGVQFHHGALRNREKKTRCNTGTATYNLQKDLSDRALGLVQVLQLSKKLVGDRKERLNIGEHCVHFGLADEVTAALSECFHWPLEILRRSQWLHPRNTARNHAHHDDSIEISIVRSLRVDDLGDSQVSIFLRTPRNAPLQAA